ncbi:hypothetical protein BSKO_11085 [Bryopsis sp. KO-2023]|nr:hypothetical protein BSKO_11085 [Bryopsis sp. KO-2023]
MRLLWLLASFLLVILAQEEVLSLQGTCSPPLLERSQYCAQAVSETMTTAPYGSWASPITSDLIVAAAIGLGGVVLSDHGTFWLEGRPTEGGRIVLVKRKDNGEGQDVTPAEFNIRTRVHEYGGAAHLLVDETFYFSNFKDQRIYRQNIDGSEPTPVTGADVDMRFADYRWDSGRKSLLAVREDHTKGGKEPENTIVRIPVDGGESNGEVLVSGYDFFANPRLSPDGGKLTWTCWNHPNMPWDDSEVWVADVNEDGSITNQRKVAGEKGESVGLPEWSPDGVLYFVSDRSNWWNLFRWDGEKVESVYKLDAEFGLPQWMLGKMSTYGFESAESMICTYSGEDGTVLARLNLKTLEMTELETPFSHIGGLTVRPGWIGFVGATTTAPSASVKMDLTSGEVEILKRSAQIDIDKAYFSIPEAIEFPTTGGKTAHGYYYPPQNQDFAAPDGERPPLLVMIHGGPTAATTPTFSLGVQYWTSRGIAVFDVNYGGSTGYGREYRNRLKGQWGVVDIDDCKNGAEYVAKQGKADLDRLLITGGSAGGYTTLSALTFRDGFKAGASHYGVSDLKALAMDTHKFESRYLDGLIGPYPEKKDLYEARSPINHLEKLDRPVIFFQGDEDKVVPPNQSEAMYSALKEKGVTTSYVLFEGEQHGFRKAENIKKALDGELYFYSRVCGFDLDGDIVEVPIDNLT